MKIIEINATTGETIERQLTPEEIAEQEQEQGITPVPDYLTPRQMRLALIGHGITLTDVEAVINGLPEPTKTYAKVNWEYATSFDRGNELLNQMAHALNLSPSDLDEIFINGQTL